MIACTLKMLWWSLTTGLGTFLVLAILVIPLVGVFLWLVIRGILGVESYEKVGIIHRKAGWTILLLCLLVYVGEGLWADPFIGDYKVRIVEHVKNKATDVERRRARILIDSTKTMQVLIDALDGEQAREVLLGLIERIKDQDDLGKLDLVLPVFRAVLETAKEVYAETRRNLDEGKIGSVVRTLKDDSAKSLLAEFARDPELGEDVREAFKDWFFAPENSEARKVVETARFQIEGNAAARSAREISWYTGYTDAKEFAVIRFFVWTHRWWRGLILCLAGILVGICFVVRGTRLVNRSQDFKNTYA